ncbi:helix-turn-helix domain-containing protein [Clostridium botulinum]|uniref:helix-turn-helix domain-containing protein n=1 Tax=Clostridium botulinum TaxID=1491 RepID=UPI001E53DE2B|nr:helix-turn-helix transcriptional regulator [Clostridium botulinum]MCD3223818.1 helix-turn-helix transcriptional regulator [Clostridium botulinum C/D]MCD3295282.1 helix-turn-helix transcriptional regulator [Clostridium botulinum C/D]
MKVKFELQIKEFRMMMGISQKELAKKAELSQGYIAKLESNYWEKSPTLNTLIKISKAFNVCPYKIFRCNNNCDICKLK